MRAAANETGAFRRPDLPEAEAVRIARDLYGIAVASAWALPSERDQNLRLEDEAGRRFVLKIANGNERPQTLDLQNRALAHLAARLPDLGVPRLVRTAGGEEIGRVEAGAGVGVGEAPGAGAMGETGGAAAGEAGSAAAGEAGGTAAGEAGGDGFLVRLLSWIPGAPLARVRPHPPELLGDLGRRLGEIDRALADFSHPAQTRALGWDLMGADATILDNLPLVAEPGRRRLLERFLEHFERTAAPRLGELRTGVIHNDANDHNVLVELPASGVVDAPRRIAGLVDFGDMLHSWTAAEPAVACAYAMLGRGEPLAAAAHLLRGYQETHPLTELEADLVYELARLRLALSAVTEAFQRRREPEVEYLSVSADAVWALLGRLDEVSPRLARYRLREACGFAPCPAGARLAARLAALREADAPAAPAPAGAAGAGAAAAAGAVEFGPAFGPVLAADVERALVFDLGVDSPDAADPRGPAESEAWTRRLFRRLEDAGAAVGIGRYDEVRGCYTGPAFSSTGAERVEMRTVHLGVDLFAPSGTPVLAPLDGVVHAWRDNAERLDYGPTLILRHALPEPDGTGVSGGAAAGRDAGEFFTLYGHLSRESLDRLEAGAPVRRGEPIGAIGDRPENGDWPPHLHFQLIADLLGEEGTFPGVAPPSQRAVWLGLCPDPNLVLGLDAPVAVPRAAEPVTLLAARNRHLGPSLSVSYRTPLHIVRGAGVHLYDADGQPHLDCVNNVAHVGHSHPRVVRAGQRQMAVLNTNTRYLHEDLTRYAQRLVATLPEPLEVCFFVCSGSEANELALRLARAHTGGSEVVVLEGGYHGNTARLVDISSYKFDGPGGEGAPPWVHVAAMPDPYRGRFRHPDPEAGAKYAATVREAAGRGLERGKLAAFVAEPLLGCGGQIVPPEGYLAAAFEHVRAAGGVCVADEVQIGFGRVGTHFWGFATQGAVPDIVTLGKPIGNGHPLGAVVTTRAIADSFATGMEYFNTFGGNPVSCAIGLAVLDVIEEEGLQARALAVGAFLLEELGRLAARHPLIGDVRGRGLYLGIELVLDRETRQPAPAHAAHAVERMRERGILLSTDGPDHNVIKIKPPLVFGEADAARLVAALDEVLGEDAFRLPSAAKNALRLPPTG